MTIQNDGKRELPISNSQNSGNARDSNQQSGMTGWMSPSMSRRGFLGHVGVSTALAATAVGAPSLLANQSLASQKTRSPEIAGITPEAEVMGRVGGELRRERAFRTRLRAAIAERGVPLPSHENNGDEARYPNRIGNYSKDLPHDDIGEVLPAAYDRLLTAVTTGDPDDFARIPLGGSVKLANPQAGLALTLEGTDSGQLTIPPAPCLASAERAGEMVENYWMALTRDIPFSQYGTEPVTTAAIDELNRLSDFRGPRIDGQVTPGTLFRGLTPGDLTGPYISQFLLLPARFGPLGVIDQRYETYASGVDYLTDFDSWLACQNGQSAPQDAIGTSFIKNGRDLGSYLHVDFFFESALGAAFWLLQNGAPLNPGNPYRTSANQASGPTFGNGHVFSLLAESLITAFRAVFYQKWFVHRTLRPEEYGGLVHKTLARIATYPLHDDVLNSEAVSRIFSRHNTYLLPQANPEGCPQHPSYAEAHGSNIGANVTILKAFFDEQYVLPHPVVASDDGQSLLGYTGPDLTVGNELNKLANNCALGRDIEGVHWRSDAAQALLLGEAVAISLLRDQRHLFNEPFSGFTFTKFNGATITV